MQEKAEINLFIAHPKQGFPLVHLYMCDKDEMLQVFLELECLVSTCSARCSCDRVVSFWETDNNLIL